MPIRRIANDGSLDSQFVDLHVICRLASFFECMDTLKDKLQKVIEHFKGEITSLRTGRASPALVEDLEVEMYGAKTQLKALASISTPDSRQIMIQPWDKSAIQQIEKAIQASQLGLSPVVDGQMIRLNLPQLTEERRRDLIKILKKNLEEDKISIRKIREEVIREIEDAEKKKEISEDEKFRKKQDVQKIVDEMNKKMDDISSKKEQEIMTG